MKLLILQLLLAIATFAAVGAGQTGTNCTSEFHSILEDALEMKERCKIKGFYDCCEAHIAAKLVHLHSSASGVYYINDVCSNDNHSETQVQSPKQVRCDMDSDGGGWTVILRRRKSAFPNVNFTRNWKEYENGFGDLNTEFWLGLINISCLTTRDDVDLMIDLRKNDGNGMTWIYRKFKVDGSSEKYRLHIGEDEGPLNGNDAMEYHDGMYFSTYDNDNDLHTAHNCARNNKGGWWFKSCYESILTGPHTDTVQTWTRIAWYNGISPVYSNYDYYQNVEMKIRPKTCNHNMKCYNSWE